MKGRRSFSANEIQGIETTLRQLPRCDASRRKALQRALRRRYRFYASDFTSRGRRLTADEVEQLIAQGVITLQA